MIENITMKKMKISHLLLLIIGLILAIDGLILILMKKINLGTILPLVIGGAFCVYVLFYQKIQIFLQQKKLYQHCFKIIQIGFIAWLMSFIAFCIYFNHFLQQRQTLPPQADIIIVLGSQVKNGYPTPALQNRLDTSAVLAKHYPNSFILMTGGLDFGETIPEADVMADYLHDKYYIPRERILIENKSTSTELNFKYGAEILAEHGLSKQQSMIIVSNDFHLMRAEKIAKKVGYQHFTSYPASTPLLTRYNSWLREYFALLSGFILNEY